MVPEWLEKLLTLYGPLGLGWPVAWYFWQYSLTLHVKLDEAREREAAILRDTIQGNTSMIDALRQEIEQTRILSVRSSHSTRRSATR